MKKSTILILAVMATSTIGIHTAHAGPFVLIQPAPHHATPGICGSDSDDLDGDGVVNSQDSDVDDDGIVNSADDHPCDPDANHNGILDGNEVPMGLCGYDIDDLDGDGIMNRDDTDMDNDGIINSYDSHPCDPDANHNGILDGLEISKTPTTGLTVHWNLNNAE